MMKTIMIMVLMALFASMSTQAITIEQLNKKVQKMNERISTERNRFKVNGFASFGFVQTDSSDSYNVGVTDSINFQRYTKIGIQMTFNMDEDTSVVTQLVSKGVNSFNTNADWLYIQHNFNNGFTGKMGRFRKPDFLLSEFLDVGYAMPWTHAPEEVYGAVSATSNYEAVELVYDFEMMEWSSYLQVQYGVANTLSLVVEDLLAFNFNMNRDEYTFRAGYSQGDLKLKAGQSFATTFAALNGAYAATNKASNVVQSSNAAVFAGVAGAYDDGEHMLLAEYTSLTIDSIFPEQDGYYITYGYRMNKYMPYFTFAHNETTDDSDRDAAVTGVIAVDAAVAGAKASFDAEQDRTSIGLRYDYKPGIAIKAQFDMVDTGNTIGEFDSFPGDNKVNVFSLIIDTVF